MLFHSVGIQTTEKTFPFTFPRDEKTKSMEHCINEPKGTRRRRQQKICMMCVQVEREKSRNLLVLIKNVSQVTKNFFLSATQNLPNYNTRLNVFSRFADTSNRFPAMIFSARRI